MKKRRLSLLALVPVMIPIGMVIAQSSTNYVAQRHVTMSGGAANSSNYSVVTVIGQPSTAIVNSSSYEVSGGFLHVQRQESQTNHLWLPVILK